MKPLTFYLGTPGNQMHSALLGGMPVLVSFALHSSWMDDYMATFGQFLVDSGAYSELNSGVVVDGLAYRDFCDRWSAARHVDAFAGLDDIRGDWRRSLRNYELYGGFPTFHETDPPQLLDDLIPVARARGNWLGLGLLPPRSDKWEFVAPTLDRIPPDLHVHFFAGGEYVSHPRIDSADSTRWFRDAMALKVAPATQHLTYAECCEVVVKRYQRAERRPREVPRKSEFVNIFDQMGGDS
jgi:hypothetical protein